MSPINPSTKTEMKYKFDTIVGFLSLICLLIASVFFTGCAELRYKRTTNHNSDVVQTVTDGKGKETAVPQEEVEAKSRALLARKEVKDFLFNSSNTWDGVTYTQTKSVSTSSASVDVSEQTPKIVEHAVKGAVAGITGKPGTGSPPGGE